MNTSSYPSVSVIVPVYNVAQYITSCLSSIGNQTYKGLVECILVDDCGSDNSMALAHKFIDNYKGPITYKVLSHSVNKGLSAARNTGIRSAINDYVLFVDSDDHITDNCIEELMTHSDSGRVDMVVGSYMESTGKLFASNLSTNYYRGFSCFELFLSLKLPVTAWNKCVKRSIILNNNLFFIEGIVYEDVAWSFMVAHRISQMAFVDIPTYYYQRSNETSITRLVTPENECQNKVKMVKILWEYCDNNELTYIAPVFQYLMLCNKNCLDVIWNLPSSRYEYFNDIVTSTKHNVAIINKQTNMGAKGIIKELYYYLPPRISYVYWITYRYIHRAYQLIFNIK